MQDKQGPLRPSTVLPVARPSTVDLIATELRSAIFTGALPVGRALGEVEIATQLGVSRSPFREASQRLVQEGLLTATPGRGLRVSVIGPERVGDVYVAREAIETQALRMLVSRADDATARLESALAALEAAIDGDDPQAIGDADLEFHRRLVDAAGSPRLSRIMATLVVETRIASLSAPDGYAVRTTLSPTYRAIVDAVGVHDLDAAVLALQTQLQEAARRLQGLADEVETAEVQQQPVDLQPIDTASIAIVADGGAGSQAASS